MASLFGQAIVAVCIGTSGQYNQACNKAVDATSQQIGFRQQVDKTEDVSNHLLMSQGERTLGHAAMWTLGVGAYAYKANREKAVVFKVPTLGVADSVTNRVTPNSYGLNFQWKF